MKTARQVIEAVYSAFNRRDIETVQAYMQPDVDWPNGMEGGRVHGLDEVRTYWLRQWSMVDPHVDPVRIEEDESGNTVVDVHQVIRNLDGVVLMDRMVQHIYTIREGRIEKMEIYEPEVPAVHQQL